jgi:hypothetical protein
MRADLSRLNARLAAPEQAKLAQYTDSIRAIEQRLASLANPSKAPCAKPAVPAAGGTALMAGYAQVDQGVAAAMVDMATAALTCGLTRVAVISWEGQRGYSFLGDPHVGIHGMFHGFTEPPGNLSGIPIGEMFRRYHNYHAQNLATIRQRLGSVREGDKTVADNTLITMLNTGGQYHHGGTSYGGQFGMLLGSAGGYFKTGRFIKYPMAERTTSDLFVSIANAMGVPITRFGQQESPDASVALRLTNGPVNKGPLSDLT